jgi:uncharacterized RDD family membrane protein YckC
MPYYVVKDGQRVGPLSDEEFQHQALSGEVGPDTLVWQPGMADWKRYAEHAGAREPITVVPTTPVSDASGPTGVCAECGNTFVRDDLVAIAGASVCGGCKPLYLQRMREGAMLPHTFNYGGFWVRFVAKFIDNIILGVMGFAVQMGTVGLSLSATTQPGQFNFVQMAISWVVGLIIGLGYTTFFLGKFGATPGKMALGLKVIRSDGGRITYGRAVGRFFGEYLSGLILGIGYIMVAFDEEKRALHDHICDTRVVKS